MTYFDQWEANIEIKRPIRGEDYLEIVTSLLKLICFTSFSLFSLLEYKEH